MPRKTPFLDDFALKRFEEQIFDLPTHDLLPGKPQNHPRCAIRAVENCEEARLRPVQAILRPCEANFDHRRRFAALEDSLLARSAQTCHQVRKKLPDG